MKVAERILDVTSTLDGERVGMSIDEGALAHIMSVLTDLYSDPEMAVIREYSTNALDAHIEAGVTRPIEVTIPSALSPFLRIRDYGAGLDAADIRDIYSRYGTSTKRGSNDVIGMLGLGCKSALTYTDQFTLTGIKNGIVTQVSIARDADGAGSMTIVAQHATGDPEGVEVVIPARRVNEFENKARSFFRFWNEGTVLVDGQTPLRITGIPVGDALVVPIDELGHDTVVMGGVPYPLPGGVSWPHIGRAWRTRLVAFVPIGAVQPTPSREALQLTRNTCEALEAIGKQIGELLLDALKNEVASAGSITEAILAADKARDAGLPDGDCLYDGRVVPHVLSRDTRTWADRYQADIQADPRTFLHANRRGGRRKIGERSYSLSLTRSVPDLLVEGFTGKTLTAARRERVELFTADMEDCLRWTFVDALDADERYWTQDIRTVRWADIEALKVPRTTNGGGTKKRGTYAGILPDGTESDAIPASTIDTSLPILFANTNRWGLRRLRSVKMGLVPQGYVLALPQNRIEKFKRDFPSAQRIGDWAVEQAALALKAIPADDLCALRFQRTYEVEGLRVLDERRVDDPDLKGAIRLAQRDVIAHSETLEKWGARAGAYDGPHPLDKYPLVQYTRWGEELLDDLYLYLNAAYAARKEA